MRCWIAMAWWNAAVASVGGLREPHYPWATIRGETMVVDEKDQLTSKSISSPRQNCCTAMKHVKQFSRQTQEASSQRPFTYGGFAQPILLPVLRLISLRTASA